MLTGESLKCVNCVSLQIRVDCNFATSPSVPSASSVPSVQSIRLTDCDETWHLYIYLTIEIINFVKFVVAQSQCRILSSGKQSDIRIVSKRENFSSLSCIALLRTLQWMLPGAAHCPLETVGHECKWQGWFSEVCSLVTISFERSVTRARNMCEEFALTVVLVIIAFPVVLAMCANAANLDWLGQDSTTHQNNGSVNNPSEHHNCNFNDTRITIDYYK